MRNFSAARGPEQQPARGNTTGSAGWFRIIPGFAYWAKCRILHLAHIRRRFIRAGDAHRKNLGPWADAWVARIATLYAAHRALAAAPAGTSGHARATAAFGAALDEIDARRRIQGARPDLLHPAAAKVLPTLDREWDGLAAHRNFPDLPLDNHTAEKAIRPPGVRR